VGYRSTRMSPLTKPGVAAVYSACSGWHRMHSEYRHPTVFLTTRSYPTTIDECWRHRQFAGRTTNGRVYLYMPRGTSNRQKRAPRRSTQPAITDYVQPRSAEREGGRRATSCYTAERRYRPRLGDRSSGSAHNTTSAILDRKTILKQQWLPTYDEIDRTHERVIHTMHAARFKSVIGRQLSPLCTLPAPSIVWWKQLRHYWNCWVEDFICRLNNG